MSEKAEWEVVDAPIPDTRQTGAHWMEATLGRYWKLKVAGMVIAGIAVLVFVVMLTGVVIVLMAGVALLSIAIAKLRKFLHANRHRHGKSSLYKQPETKQPETTDRRPPR